MSTIFRYYDPCKEKLAFVSYRDFVIPLNMHTDFLKELRPCVEYNRIVVGEINAECDKHMHIVQKIIDNIPSHIKCLVLGFEKLNKPFSVDFPTHLTDIRISCCGEIYDLSLFDRLPIFLETLYVDRFIPILNPPAALQFLFFDSTIKNDDCDELFSRIHTLEKIYFFHPKDVYDFLPTFEVKKIQRHGFGLGDYYFYKRKK